MFEGNLFAFDRFLLAGGRFGFAAAFEGTTGLYAGPHEVLLAGDATAPQKCHKHEKRTGYGSKHRPALSVIAFAARTAAGRSIDSLTIGKMPPWLLIGLCLAARAFAQDPFEIHVYEYEPMARGQYSLEAHLNLSTQGNALRDGTTLPTHDQTHLTFEPTVGVSETLAIGLMFLNAWEPGYSPQFAGWRVLPHFYAPERWHLPVHLGFVAEFSFQKVRYEENSRRAELRPIVDREFNRWQLVFNPVFERALHGPGVAHGWNFEPAALIRWKRDRFAPSLEYYGEIESINTQPHSQPEVHQLFVGGDWQVKDDFKVNLGTGFDLGPRGPGVILKSRFEWHWGATHNP